jgi:hypothetical protein
MSVKKRYRLFTILSVLVVSVGGILTWRAAAVTVIPAGYDEFNTIGSGGTSEQWNSLPAGFFANKEGFGSLAVAASTPTFTGRNPVPGFTGDTVIERTNSVSVPGATALVVAGLRFVGESELTVSFSQGTPSVTYTVLVDESGTVPSTGDMTFNSDGTYSSGLTINRKYTFVPTDSSQPTRTAESATEHDSGGNLIFPAINLTGTGTWSAPSGASASGIQPQAVTTQPPGGGGSTPVASPTPNKCFINPSSEAGVLASHGILPAGCPKPSPSPTPSASPLPTVTPKPIPGM